MNYSSFAEAKVLNCTIACDIMTMRTKDGTVCLLVNLNACVHNALINNTFQDSKLLQQVSTVTVLFL